MRMIDAQKIHNDQSKIINCMQFIKPLRKRSSNEAFSFFIQWFFDGLQKTDLFVIVVVVGFMGQ